MEFRPAAGGSGGGSSEAQSFMTPRPASGDTRTKEHREAKQIESQKSKFLERLRSQLDRKLNSYKKEETNKKLSTPTATKSSTPVPVFATTEFFSEKKNQAQKSERSRKNQPISSSALAIRNAMSSLTGSRPTSRTSQTLEARHHYRNERNKENEQEQTITSDISVSAMAILGNG